MQARILVLEDDDLQRYVLRDALGADGHSVETAAGGLEAVWQARCGRYDLVLLDYQVPEVDGLAVARLIRELMGDVACPPLVALTAAPERLLGHATEGAFDGIIAKSADIPALLADVRRHLALAPDGAARREAEDVLLADEWAEFDIDPERPSAPNGVPARLRILVAEDDDLQRSILKRVFETSGYRVETVHDGIEAVRRIRERGYDLALIDYQMPNLDGFAAASVAVGLLSEATRPRLIAFTSAPDRLGERQRTTGCMFDEIVSKSLGLPGLVAVVDRHLRGAPNSATRRAAEAVAAR